MPLSVLSILYYTIFLPFPLHLFFLFVTPSLGWILRLAAVRYFSPSEKWIRIIRRQPLESTSTNLVKYVSSFSHR